MTDQELTLSVAAVESLLTGITDKAMAHDDEEAHYLQDELYRKVLEAVAGGNPESAALAATALRCQDISFARWYA